MGDKRDSWLAPAGFTHAKPLPRIYDIKQEIAFVLSEKNDQHASKDKKVSTATMKDRGDEVFRVFDDLRGRDKVNIPLKWAKNLRQWHVKALMLHWVEVEDHMPRTIDKKIGALRTFMNWLGKEKMIQKAEYYYPQDPGRVRCIYVTNKDKSWSGKGIDPYLLIPAVEREDFRVGLQLYACLEFGLRVEEAISIKPQRANRSFKYIAVTDGTKGGRDRVVDMETEEQVRFLERVCQVVKSARESLGDPSKTQKQCIRRFYYVLTQHGITKSGLGITAHGLRHEMLHGVFHRHSGVEPPVRGGVSPDRTTDVLARLRVAETAGHARLQIASMYLGSPRIRLQPDKPPSIGQEKR
jgi:integrase